MKHSFQTINVSQINNYSILLTLNRPSSSNAFNTLMANEINSFFENLKAQDNFCRAVIITGSGTKAFSAGGDLKERRGMTIKSWKTQHIVFEKMIRSILDCEIPVIGAINGVAYGGGCELVAAFDFAYASETATFAQTETKIGIIPGIGGTQNLTRAVGERRAKELIFSAEPFSAQQALEWGLINSIFPSKYLLEETIKIALQITKNAPLAIKEAKKAIHGGLQLSLTEGMELELACYNKTIITSDRIEGVEAFNEKRNPDFKGK